MTPKTKTVASFYEAQASSERKPYEDRAVKHSQVTIPYLFTEDTLTNNKHKSFIQRQSIGSKGVNSLASKLLITQFPANTPFFRFDYPKEQMDEILNTLKETAPDQSSDIDALRGKVEKELSNYEQLITTEIETQAMRPVLNSALKQLIVTGNVLLHLPDKGGIKMYRLHNFIVVRDSSGKPYRIIAKDIVRYDTLSKDLLDEAKLLDIQESEKEKDIHVFTDIQWNQDTNKWDVVQEINEHIIESSRGTYHKDRLPWIPLRFIRMDGEHYGRAYVEEYYGDLLSVSELREAITDGSKASAKLLVMVRPNSSTKKKDIAESPNGAIVNGDANDVSMLQAQKHADLAVAERTSEQIKSDLKDAFLMKNTRQAERVTREEIRRDAEELEDTLGGIYSTLSHELQTPLVNILMHRTLKKTKFSFFPKDALEPRITTGIEALGRGNDLQKLRLFLQTLVESLGIEGVLAILKGGNLVDRVAASIGINTEGLIKSEEERAQEAQQNQMMAMSQQALPQLMQMLNQSQGNQNG